MITNITKHPPNKKCRHAFLPPHNLLGSRPLIVLSFTGKPHRGSGGFTVQGPSQNPAAASFRQEFQEALKHRFLNESPLPHTGTFLRRPRYEKKAGKRETSNYLSICPFLFVNPRKQPTAKSPHLPSGRPPGGFLRDRKLSVCVSRALSGAHGSCSPSLWEM